MTRNYTVETYGCQINVNDSEKEITTKLNLKDFAKALEYYSNKVSNK